MWHMSVVALRPRASADAIHDVRCGRPVPTLEAAESGKVPTKVPTFNVGTFVGTFHWFYKGLEGM